MKVGGNVHEAIWYIVGLFFAPHASHLFALRLVVRFRVAVNAVIGRHISHAAMGIMEINQNE